MKVLKVEYLVGKSFHRLHFSYTKRFVSYLRGLESRYRKFDPATKTWLVHESLLVAVILVAKKYFSVVDCTDLPSRFQDRYERHRSSTEGRESSQASTTQEAYSKLHLLSTAPMSVVDAVYKALAMEKHPDRGGSTVEFQELSAAYAQIKEKKGQ
jgi:hypothetical protein